MSLSVCVPRVKTRGHVMGGGAGVRGVLYSDSLGDNYYTYEREVIKDILTPVEIVRVKP